MSPVVSPSTATPFPTAQDILNRARAISNDAAQSLAGNLLSDAQPYTFELLNAAYDYVKAELANKGEPFPTKEAIISAIPPVDSTLTADTSVQMYIDYTGTFDGVTTFDTPTLPQDMMNPLRLWCRQSAVNQNFLPMQQANDGLPSIAPVAQFGVWDWRSYKIYLNGTTESCDIRVRYESFYPNLAADDDQAMIFTSVNAIANGLVWMFALARGSTLAPVYKQNCDMYIGQIATRKNRTQQRAQHRRIPYGGNGFSRRRNTY